VVYQGDGGRLARCAGSPRAGCGFNQRKDHGGKEAGGRGLRQRASAAGTGQRHHARERRPFQGPPPRQLAHRQASQALLNAPDATNKGLRDQAILAVLLGCGLRRSEVAALTFKHIQPRDGRWCIVDLVGKRRHGVAFHGESVILETNSLGGESHV
jgi:integrase